MSRFVIVVALDLSEYSEIVVEHALDQAARHDDVDLHFLTVGDGDLDACKERLAMLALPALDELKHTSWRARLHVRDGKPHEAIAEVAEELGANLVIIGRFGVHHPHRHIGAVASRVIDVVTCPTLVVGLVDREPEAPERCLACAEVREASEGDTLFCAAHAADRVISSSLGPTSMLTGGTLMW